MQPIKPQPGSALDISSFVGRLETTRLAIERLSDSVNLALTDPRRMGKTYWLKFFCATTDAFVSIIIDYEGVRTREEFLLRTASSLAREAGVPAKARHVLRSFFANTELSAGPLTIKPGVRSLGPTQLLIETVLAVNEHATGKPVLVCMDEVPLAIRNIANNESPQAAREVLQTLRDLQATATRLRWVMCGSVGFHHVLRHCGATEGDINQLYSLPLGPLQADESLELAQRLLLGVKRPHDQGAASRLAIVTGGIPFLMHHVAAPLLEGDGHISPDDVERSFDDFIADRDGSRAVTHMLTRLDGNYGAETGLAQQILDTTATVAGPVAVSALQTAHAGVDLVPVLDLLIDDHYLSRRGSTVQWRYDVLRVIWSRRRYLDNT